ncbi:MAG: sialidase family protein [Gammaproteobacteria bacterium]|nr:sialidase family protein [Gammaproteobacteria bacterium]
MRAGKLLAILLVLASLGACSGEAPGHEILASPVESPAAPGSAEPHLQASADGTVILSWLESAAGKATLRYSVYENQTWSSPHTVASGDDWFVNWADFPSVTRINSDLWAAHWLQKRPGGTYAYDVRMAFSGDGVTWQPAISPHDDGTPTEHGFVSMVALGDTIGAVWLDGRRTAQTGGHDMNGGAADGGMTLRWATIDGGGQVLESTELDSLICDCCQTDLAKLSNGVAVVYRDRSENEIRDIGITRLTESGWSKPALVANDGWQIAGCPVNGPAVDSRADKVAVAWFTGADNIRQVRMAFSDDGGLGFSEPVTISSGTALGRVDVSWVADGLAVISWLDELDTKTAALRIRTVARNGTLGETLLIALTGSQRSSGFPHMLLAGGDLLFAWTDTGEQSRVLTARLSLAEFLDE